jgi:uncharacterized protein (DUF433 family)
MANSKGVAPGVTMNPRVRFGKPVIKGTRLDVATVLYQLAAGVTMEELSREYAVSQEDIRNAIGYAAELVAAQDPARD